MAGANTPGVKVLSFKSKPTKAKATPKTTAATKAAQNNKKRKEA
jgi:hypothetical protein